MKSWSNSTRAGHAAIPDSRRPDIRIGRSENSCADRKRLAGRLAGPITTAKRIRIGCALDTKHDDGRRQPVLRQENPSARAG